MHFLGQRRWLKVPSVPHRPRADQKGCCSVQGRSNTMLQGHIPERVIYVAGAARRVRICWEDDDTRTVVDEEVRPCFAADKHSPKSLATAKTWAQARRGKQ